MRYAHAVRWLPLLLLSLLWACSQEDLSPSSEGDAGAPIEEAHTPREVGDTQEPSPREPLSAPELSDVVDATLEDTERASAGSADAAISQDVPLSDGSGDGASPPGPDDALSGGDIDPDDAQEASAGPLEVTPTPAPLGASPGRAPMRRLTRHELENTLADLSGVSGVASATLPPEPETAGFDNHVDTQDPSPSFVEALLLSAEKISASVDLDALFSCDSALEGELVCAELFVTEVGRKAFRRPLSEEQVARFSALSESAREAWGYEEALRVVLSAMLMSPHFVYRVELGLVETETEGVVRLSPHEMAARLSYLLYQSSPDAELAQAADAGELVTLESIEGQAKRMLGEGKSMAMIDHFHRQWLLLDRLLFMAPISEKFASFRTETRLFVQRVLSEGDGSFYGLMTGTETALDPALATVYSDPSLGPLVETWIPGAEGFRWAEVDAERRAGVLTHPSVLSVHAVGPSAAKTLIRRGAFIMDRILCAPLPPPPEGVPELPLDEDTDLSPPELLESVTGDPACAGCHGVINPVGATFEHYAPSGAWRDDYHDGTPIDASATLVGTPIDGGYPDAVALAHALAESEVAKRCYARHWYRFAHGRGVEAEDEAAFEAVLEAFLGADGEVRTLIEALTRSDAFLYRLYTPPGQEVSP